MGTMTETPWRYLNVHAHNEDGKWWAEAVSPKGYYAAADTQAELTALVREGVEFLGYDGYTIIWPFEPATSGGR